MAPRPIWKGYLKLSLVSCAVALYSATSTADRIRFHIINRKTGNRIHNEVVDAETGDPVEDEDQVKGFEIEKGRYVLIDDEELDEVALESTHTIEIEAFVPREEVDEIFHDGSYYVAPIDDVAAEAFTVIREAMRKENVVGLARVVLYRRERLLMLAPRGKGLMATVLRYRNEVRDEKKYFADIPKEKISADMLDLATHIIKSKLAHFDPDKFKDRYETALAELIKAKDQGTTPPKPPTPRHDNVINLMDALRRSVKSEQRESSAHRVQGSGKRPRARKAPAKRRASSHRRLKRAS
jgi:DNA end-binding protein Ku